MEIRLLKSGYKKSEQFYKDFLEINCNNKLNYFVFMIQTLEFIYIA